MADQAHDIIVLGFRQSVYTKRGPRKPDGTAGDIIDDKAPEYWVKYCNRGMPQSTATEDRMRHLDPANLRDQGSAETAGEKLAFLQYRWDQIMPYFEAWRSNQAMPEYGIPIAAWPGLDPDQVKVLVASGIRSIEDMRDISEGQMSKVRLPNVRELKKAATLYLEGLTDAKAAEREAKRDAEIAGLKEQLAAAMALLEESAKANAESQGGKRKAA